MSNNLKKLEKMLRSFAKRNKNMKYTLGLLVSFLLTGMITFSFGESAVNQKSYMFKNYAQISVEEEVPDNSYILKKSMWSLGKSAKFLEDVNKDKKFSYGLANYEIVGENTAEADNASLRKLDEIINKTDGKINSSMSDIRTAIKEAKKENERLIKNSNIELIQLMEQGDQVIKSPWSSWHIGLNTFVEESSGTYKGRGDKSRDVIYERTAHGSSYTYSENTSSSYGLTTLGFGEVIEPKSEISVNASVNPRNIVKGSVDIKLPSVSAPNSPNITINAKEIAGVSKISVNPPEVNLDLPNPNAVPFNDFCFTGCGTPQFNRENEKVAEGKTYWAGYNPNTGKLTPGAGIGKIVSSNKRASLSMDIGTTPISDVVVHVAGNVGGIGKSVGDKDGEIGIHIVNSTSLTNVTGNLYGRAAFLSIETWHGGLIELNNVNVNIKKVENINSYTAPDENPGENNTIFYIYPSTYHAIFNYGNANTQRGGFTGNLNADITTKKNVVYSIMGAQGSFNIDSAGEYNLIGADNIVYSGLGYSPNLDKIKGVKDSSITNEAVEFTPSVKLTTPPNSYGDNNILMFFSNRINSEKITYWTNTGTSDAEKKNWLKSTIGIYQGEILAKGIIGKYLQKYSGTGKEPSEQTEEGNTPYVNNVEVEQDPSYVENNVGILAKSGQRGEQIIETSTGVLERAKIIPSTDLGAEQSTAKLFNENDPIHSLQVNDIDISFGKYSRNGIMLVSQNGTVLDVAKTSNQHKSTDASLNTTAIRTTPITDYGLLGSAVLKASHNDASNQVATGTIIALAEGKWKDSVNKMSSLDAKRFENLGSEVNIGQDVIMTARYKKISETEKYYPIAYIAKDGGIVTAEKSTEARGFGSIIAYAENGGEVKTGFNSTFSVDPLKISGTLTQASIPIGYVAGQGGIKAIDEWAEADSDTIPYLYTNIGGYAKSSGDSTVVTINGKAEINGLGAVASGKGAEVYLKATDNYIKTSESGGLAALDGGYIEFGGGTIVNEDFTVSTASGTAILKRNNTTPFYSGKSNTGTEDGIINFTNNTAGTTNTTIEMSTGLLKEEADSDYSAGTATAPSISGGNYVAAIGSKYNGMENVKVKLTGDEVVFKIVNGETTNWTNMSSYLTDIIGASGMKLGDFDFNGKSYKSYYTNGIFNLTGSGSINLDNSSTSGLSVSGSPGALIVGGTNSNEIEFNNIAMEREIVNIGPNMTITSTTGKGLAMASNDTATVAAGGNSLSGYKNEGTISITGGGTSANTAVALNVSYGVANNASSGKISVDEGVGIYGTNGSKLINSGTINITSKGYGIVGKVTDTASLKNYGTDAGNAGKKVEIINSGTINITGGTAASPVVAIYAENNIAGAVQSEVTIDNSSELSVGDYGIGIAAVKSGTGTAGGTITVTDPLLPTGNANITAGKNGIGIYAEDSVVSLNTSGNYVIETKENGTGIFAAGTTSVTGSPSFEYRYNGSSAGTGMGIVYSGENAVNNVNVKLVNRTSTTGGLVGIYANGKGSTGFINNKEILGTSSASEFGIVGEDTNIINRGKITLSGNPSALSAANVGIFVKKAASLSLPKAINDAGGAINVGDYSVGIYGYDIENKGTVEAGDGGIGVYSQGGDVGLFSGNIKVAEKEAVGVYLAGKGQTVKINDPFTFTIGNSSFGVVNSNIGTSSLTGNKIESNMNDVTLNNNSVYIYSADPFGTVANYTNITTTGADNYGLYTSGKTENYGNMNLNSGVGNIGIFAASGTAINGKDPITGKKAEITVGRTDTAGSHYGVGMASLGGTIENEGIINVHNDNSIGMYASGNGSKAINRGEINLSGANVTGMYLDNYAIGENRGIIRSVPNASNDGIKGVVALNNAIFKNYGKIIIDSPDGIGVYYAKDGKVQEETSSEISVSGTDSSRIQTSERTDTSKGVKGVSINLPYVGALNATVSRGDSIITPISLDTDVPAPAPKYVIVGPTVIDLSTFTPSYTENNGGGSSIGMYIDTSGVNYTNPIEGLENLKSLSRINLILGVEASQYTNEKDIEIGENILKPYNDSILSLSTSNPSIKWQAISSSLTWIATPTQNTDDTIAKVYLSKVPYTVLTQESDTYNFLDGLEQRYGVEGLDSREKLLFNKLNSLRKGEAHIFTQAVNEMKGYQYSNTQQRIKSTGDLLSKEFSHLSKEWKTESKDSNKIKLFGMKNEYSTDTAGVIDYKSNAYGVAYLHENETIKLGNTTGWYIGVVNNSFEFEDMGKSEENQTLMKGGIFKSKAFDDNNSLNWTVSGEVFAGINSMTRKYWIVDEVFQAQSDYYTYGGALKNEIGKTFRTGERTSIRPYGSLKLEYGNFTDIQEKKGEMRLEVKGNDYYSIKPEVGVEFKYERTFAKKATFTSTLTVAYENELGKVNDVENKARVGYTSADWYNLRGEKENRSGNFKADLNVGIENTRVGITMNAGYDSYRDNFRAGIGIRAIY